MSADLVGWAALVPIAVGTWAVGGGHRWGWMARAVGDALWVVVGLMSGLSSIVVAEAAFLAIDLRGWWKWRPR